MMMRLYSPWYALTSGLSCQIARLFKLAAGTLVESEPQHAVSATFVRGNILALAKVFSLFAERSARRPESPKTKPL